MFIFCIVSLNVARNVTLSSAMQGLIFEWLRVVCGGVGEGVNSTCCLLASHTEVDVPGDGRGHLLLSCFASICRGIGEGGKWGVRRTLYLCQFMAVVV